jgi:hypothetical protein
MGHAVVNKQNRMSHQESLRVRMWLFIIAMYVCGFSSIAITTIIRQPC